MNFFTTQSFREFIESTQLVVGVTRMDESQKLEIEDYTKALTKLNLRAPVFEVDARAKADVSVMIKALMHSLEVSSQNA